MATGQGCQYDRQLILHTYVAAVLGWAAVLTGRRLLGKVALAAELLAACQLCKVHHQVHALHCLLPLLLQLKVLIFCIQQLQQAAHEMCLSFLLGWVLRLGAEAVPRQPQCILGSLQQDAPPSPLRQHIKLPALSPFACAQLNQCAWEAQATKDTHRRLAATQVLQQLDHKLQDVEGKGLRA